MMKRSVLRTKAKGKRQKAKDKNTLPDCIADQRANAVTHLPFLPFAFPLFLLLIAGMRGKNFSNFFCNRLVAVAVFIVRRARS